MKLIIIIALSIIGTCTLKAQDSTRMVRMAKIKVDPGQLQQYTYALKEQMASAIKLEPGVLSYHAVADKKDPSQITIIEIYANNEAYLLHIKTPHFLKYKDLVKDMVLSLELIDVETIGRMSK